MLLEHCQSVVEVAMVTTRVTRWLVSTFAFCKSSWPCVHGFPPTFYISYLITMQLCFQQTSGITAGKQIIFEVGILSLYGPNISFCSNAMMACEYNAGVIEDNVWWVQVPFFWLFFAGCALTRVSLPTNDSNAEGSCASNTARKFKRLTLLYVSTCILNDLALNSTNYCPHESTNNQKPHESSNLETTYKFSYHQCKFRMSLQLMT